MYTVIETFAAAVLVTFAAPFNDAFAAAFAFDRDHLTVSLIQSRRLIMRVFLYSDIAVIGG